MPEAHFPVGGGGGGGGGEKSGPPPPPPPPRRGVRNVAPPLLGNLGANKVL